MQFSKGHGTGNDFVLLPDPDGELDLPPGRVAALCDRRTGLGADGVLRVVRWAALGPAGPAPVDGVEWFMDYRNADGGVAQMCGNGVRVFALYLRHRGWVDGGELTIGTRAGVRGVRFADGRDRRAEVDTGAATSAVSEAGTGMPAATGATAGIRPTGAAGSGTGGSVAEVSVDMGPALTGGAGIARLDGHAFPGLAVDLGNPHLACVTDVALTELDLRRAPEHDPAQFPDGVNVEFVTPLRRGLAGDEITMRVHERGVGETRSCGTGTVAAVVAALAAAGRRTGDVAVTTPGGALRVTVTDRSTVLQGPAVLVAHGSLDPHWCCRSCGEETERTGGALAWQHASHDD